MYSFGGHVVLLGICCAKFIVIYVSEIEVTSFDTSTKLLNVEPG